MSGGQLGSFKASDQRPISSDREDALELPPWQGQGGRMEGSGSFRNSGVVGFRGGGAQGLGLGGGGYGTPNYGVGGFGGGRYGGGVLGGEAGVGTGISGAGVGAGYGAGSGGGGFQAGGVGGGVGGGGLQAGGFGGPSSRIFTSPGRPGLFGRNSILNLNNRPGPIGNGNIIFGQVPAQGFQTGPPVIRNSQGSLFGLDLINISYIPFVALLAAAGAAASFFLNQAIVNAGRSWHSLPNSWTDRLASQVLSGLEMSRERYGTTTTEE